MNALLSLYVYVKNIFEVEEGQDLIEYALIIALVVIAAVGALTAFGGDIQNFLTGVGDNLSAATT